MIRSKLMWTEFWLLEAKRPGTWLKLVWFTLWLWRPFRFALIGGLSVPVGLGSLWVLTDLVGIHYLASNVFAFTLSTLCWFYGHRYWTFNDRKQHYGLLKSVPTKLVALGLGEGLLALFVEVFGLWYMFGALLAILFVFPLTYLISNKWIWRESESS